MGPVFLLSFRSLAFDLLVATLLPGFGVAGFVRLDESNALRFLEVILLACVRPNDLW